ncbi:MAG: hypothetical protein ACLPXW_12135 [Xanthobacteraceae bacterium]
MTIALSRPAADQRVVDAFVKATNSPAVVSLLADFEMGSEKKFRFELLNRETDGLCGVRKTSVADHRFDFRLRVGNSSASAL